MAHLHLLWSSSHYGIWMDMDQYKPIHKVELSGATKLPNQKLVGILQFTYVLVHLICMTMVIGHHPHKYTFFSHHSEKKIDFTKTAIFLT